MVGQDYLLFKSAVLISNRYRNLKDAIQVYRGKDKKLTSLDYFASSGASGKHFGQYTNEVELTNYRHFNCNIYQPDMGHQNTDALHWTKCTRSISEHVARNT
jgi:hypothetical protein